MHIIVAPVDVSSEEVSLVSFQALPHGMLQALLAIDRPGITEAFSISEPATRIVIFKINEENEDFRRLAATIVSVATNKRSISLDLRLVEAVTGLYDRYAIEIAQGIVDRENNFDRRYNIITEHADLISAHWKRHDAVAQGTKLARRLVDLPPNQLTPQLFVAECLKLEQHGVSVEIFDEEALRTENMDSMLAVGRGSSEPSFAVVLRWKGNASQPILIAGKGVCFDSGGLSLKTAEGMMTMKSDMAGAATAVGTVLSLALQKAQCHVVAILGLVENMPSGSAMRPGDVVTSRDGKTIEILNTDCEGRLVLADILSLARSYEPSVVISLGTLTGGVKMALGNSYAGLFTRSEKLAEQTVAAGRSSAEEVWRLPLDGTFDTDLRSDSADLRNIGKRPFGSASVCARFLEHFIAPVPWIHLDIAGVALGYRTTDQSKASGYGVRLLEEIVAQSETPASPCGIR